MLELLLVEPRHAMGDLISKNQKPQASTISGSYVDCLEYPESNLKIVLWR